MDANNEADRVPGAPDTGGSQRTAAPQAGGDAIVMIDIQPDGALSMFGEEQGDSSPARAAGFDPLDLFAPESAAADGWTDDGNEGGTDDDAHDGSDDDTDVPPDLDFDQLFEAAPDPIAAPASVPAAEAPSFWLAADADDATLVIPQLTAVHALPSNRRRFALAAIVVALLAAAAIPGVAIFRRAAKTTSFSSTGLSSTAASSTGLSSTGVSPAATAPERVSAGVPAASERAPSRPAEPMVRQESAPVPPQVRAEDRPPPAAEKTATGEPANSRNVPPPAVTKNAAAATSAPANLPAPVRPATQTLPLSPPPRVAPTEAAAPALTPSSASPSGPPSARPSGSSGTPSGTPSGPSSATSLGTSSTTVPAIAPSSPSPSPAVALPNQPPPIPPESRAAVAVVPPVVPTVAPPVAAAPPSSATASATATATATAVTRTDDTVLIQTTLSRYRTAFGGLDAGAASAVWPTVDQKALGRAFGRLAQQSLTFDNCTVDVRGTRASATCKGTANYVPKVGSKTPRTDNRQWTFDLRKVDEQWLIDAVNSR